MHRSIQNILNRRSLVAGAVAAPMASLAGPSLAKMATHGAADHLPALMAVHDRVRSLYDRKGAFAEAHGLNAEEAFDAVYIKPAEIEEAAIETRLMSAPVRDMRDLAAKAFVIGRNGSTGFSIEEHAIAIFDDAKRLLGEG